MDYLPDETIMQKIKDGNLSEMAVLFERYHLKLYNFFIRMGLKKDIGQDLTQNLFYRMMKYRHAYKSGNSVKSWMYQIARNLYSDYCKQQQKSDELLKKIETYPDDKINEAESYQEEDYERLDRALSALNDTQKEIIVMRRYQGLKYEEISMVTGQSVAAIKVAMHRAIKQLRCIYFEQI